MTLGISRYRVIVSLYLLLAGGVMAQEEKAEARIEQTRTTSEQAGAGMELHEKGNESRAVLTDILFLTFGIPFEADQWYQKNAGNTQHPTKTWEIEKVYSGPSSSAPLVGVIWLVSKWSEDAMPHLFFNLEYESLTTGKRSVWMNKAQIDDWGYLIRQFVLESRNGFHRLPPGPFPEEAWVELGESSSYAKEKLLHFSKVSAVNDKTNEFELIDGVFCTTRIQNGFVYCRPEIPSDFPCGHENPVDPPEESIPVFRIPSHIMLDALITARVQVAYRRGC